ncbi:MAG: EF-hand domain-containing protein [Phycisphaerae bacterium]
MTKKLMNTFVAATAALCMVFVGAVFASDDPAKPISTDRQANLLEKFGDQGIDADSDGVLTHAEVKAFFAQKHHRGGACAHGAKGGWHHGMMGGMGHGIKGGMHHGAMGKVDMLLRHLTKLDAKSVPADFNVARHPQADADGDGEVSDEEWLAFAEQARVRMLGRLLSHAPEADTDADGKLSEEELAALRIERAAKLREHVLAKNPDADADGDGVLSETEFEAFMAKRAAEHRAMMLKAHPEADTNGDGTLSEKEARAFTGSRGGDCYGAGRPGHGDRGCPGSKSKGCGHGSHPGNGS